MKHHIRREVLKVLKNNGHKSYRPKALAKQLGYKDNRRYRLFREVLTELAQQGIIARIKGGQYTYRSRSHKAKGLLQVHPQGYGFVTVEGESEDLFIPASRMKTALDGDEVLIGMGATPRGGRREAEILKVIKRHRTQAVGTFRRVGHFGLVQPDDQRLVHDIYVPEGDSMDAREGDKVIVTIDSFTDPRGAPEGRILQVIGDGADPAVQVLALALSYDVRAGFPEDVREEANQIHVPAPADMARRFDLRSVQTFTIDPDDAKDFDDAIHVIRHPDGTYELGVHIADVSHYVEPGGALDREARARGTSVYLVDRVIPMLPERLSNDICSLRPDEDKLTFSCIMQVGADGTVGSHQVVTSVIRSKHRLTYAEAQDIITGKAPDHPLVPDLGHAAELAAVLKRRRMDEGSIDFDLPEVQVVLDDVGHPVDIIPKPRQASNRLIEEFMLLANKTVAEHMGRQKPPRAFVYRIHDFPNEERIRKLATYVKAYGLRLPHTDGRVVQRDLNALLDEVKGSVEERVVETAIIRAMAKAVYSTDNIGHYGLGFSFYTHFTSPIRRYPDLLVHRLLKALAQGETPVEVEGLEGDSKHCSDRERAAQEAERESVKLKQVQYMQAHLGETFAGVISGITRFGLFVNLDQILVEGLVHVRDLEDDYYEYDEERYRLVGQYSNKTYRLGDPVTVQVAAANVETREIDFIFP